MTILRSIRAPILKRLIALCPPPHPNPRPTPKEKSEPRIFGPQGDTNVFTAINLFKIGAFPGDDHSSLYTGADFETVDCPLPTPHHIKKSETRVFGPQGDTSVSTAINLFSKSAHSLVMTIIRSIWAPILKRLIALYPHPHPTPKEKSEPRILDGSRIDISSI